MTSIDLLGPVLINGNPTDTAGRTWKYSKTPELVALLVLNPNGISIDRAIDALTDSAPNGKRIVHQVACDARRELGADVFPPARDTYRLDLSVVDVDLARFAQHLDDAADSTGPARLRHLLAALAEIRGRILGDADWPWADIDLAEITGRIEQAALDAVALALDLDHPSAAVTAARAGLRIDSYHPDLMAQFARAALAAGDAGAIMRAMAVLADFWGHDAPAEVIAISDELAATRRARVEVAA